MNVTIKKRHIDFIIDFTKCIYMIQINSCVGCICVFCDDRSAAIVAMTLLLISNITR